MHPSPLPTGGYPQFSLGPVESDIHGQQGRYRAIVRDQFTGIGKLVPVLALDLGGIPATIQGRILLGLRQHLVIGHEESIPALRPDGMLHRPFPDHAAHAGSTRLVLCERANVLDATCTDENATGAFHKGHMFGVEETKGILRAEMTGEGVEQGQLVLSLVYPGCLVGQSWLAILIHVKFEQVAEVFHVAMHQPEKRDNTGGIRRIPLGGGEKVPIDIRVNPCQGMCFADLYLKRRHEHGALLNTAGPVLLRQFLQTATGKREFLLIFLIVGDSFQLGARTIQLGRLAHGACPACIVPRDSD